ncbi:hypothetical protein R3P38DRAFT_2776465 [Favolaschia claudopus]|uniref:Uncharacterized protein n=1 Tax=Favolaschia claudopus TaxID=2862362 RepID=A0AAW0BPZ0_9AGAR
MGSVNAERLAEFSIIPRIAVFASSRCIPCSSSIQASIRLGSNISTLPVLHSILLTEVGEDEGDFVEAGTKLCTTGFAPNVTQIATSKGSVAPLPGSIDIPNFQTSRHAVAAVGLAFEWTSATSSLLLQITDLPHLFDSTDQLHSVLLYRLDRTDTQASQVYDVTCPQFSISFLALTMNVDTGIRRYLCSLGQMRGAESID